MNAFHSGCIGDIIYSMPTMKALGVTNLYVANRPWTKPIENRIGAFSRLLESQGVSVNLHSGEDINYDLSTYRNGGMLYGDNIASRVARWVGVKIDPAVPWIQINEENQEAKGKIIVSRGARWHGEFFPWKDLVEALGYRMLFVGLEEEHDVFCDRFGIIEYLPTVDLYDVARAIKSADLFIGNQSSPNSIANGIGARSIVETCLYAFDCIYRRDNVIYCHDGNLEFELDGKPYVLKNDSTRYMWSIEIEGKTLKTKDRHTCIALARADCYLRGISKSVDQISEMVKRY